MLKRLALRSDLGVVILLVCAIALMIVPLPTMLVDMLLATNIGISLLLLMVAFYLQTAVQFSTLPAVILITTVFRLSLSIAVTRLILTQADAGDIVRAFGNFVVAGNLLVGLVIFLIITVVQFIVITKGAERVAEVAARFTLDAMPGKQMAIDADMRSGEIDQEAGRIRRRALEQESQLYGAMDGAMKFVKGDSIAGLVIIVINLIGGLVVGVLQHGMSFTDAAATYSILTVGDGLVAQIPALLVSITAGTVVTRVTGGGGDSLGAEIAGQLGHDSRALNLASVLAVLLGFIPGFPTFMFLGLAAIFFLLGRAAARRKVVRDDAARPRATVPPPPARVQIYLSAALMRDLTASAVEGAVARAFTAIAGELGIPVPAVATQQAVLPERRFRADLDGVPLAEGEIPPAVLLLRDDAANAELAGVPVIAGRVLPGTAETLWVAEAQRKTLGSAGIGYMEPADALAQSIAAVIRRQASQLIGLQETRQIYVSAEQHWGDLAREAQRLLPPQRSADLFRRLLDDGLSLRNLRGLLEAILEHAPREQEPSNLAELVRAGMRRQICHLYADPLRVIGAFIIEGEAEQILRDAMTKGAAGPLSLAEGAVSALIDRVRAELSASSGPGPVVLTIADLRRPLRLLLANNGVYAPVLAFADLLPDYTVQALGQIRLSEGEKVEQISIQPRAA